jgi:hypothetical protein
LATKKSLFQSEHCVNLRRNSLRDMPQKQPIAQYLLLGVLLVIAFGFGFWFGAKQQKVVSSTSGGTAQSRAEKAVIAQPVPGVFWIAPGSGACPDDHPIKAKIDGTIGFYYLPDNKSYDRVKPVFCFATEAYAKESAGFIKK